MKEEKWEEVYRFLDIKLIHVEDFTELLIRLVLNTFLVFVVTHFMYARNSRNRDFYFSYLAVGTVTFLLCFLLNNVKLELGFALGLFAIFGIIRYRTDTIPIKEMTYLFVVIGVSVINALSNKKVSYAELMLTHAAVITGLWLLEKKMGSSREESLSMTYEKIENIRLDDRAALIEDIETRTGLNVLRIEVEKIDFLRDTAEIRVFYRAC